MCYTSPACLLFYVVSFLLAVVYAIGLQQVSKGKNANMTLRTTQLALGSLAAESAQVA